MSDTFQLIKNSRSHTNLHRNIKIKSNLLVDSEWSHSEFGEKVNQNVGVGVIPALKHPRNGKQIKTHDSIKIEGDQSWVVEQLTKEQLPLDKLGMPDVL